MKGIIKNTGLAAIVAAATISFTSCQTNTKQDVSNNIIQTTQTNTETHNPQTRNGIKIIEKQRAQIIPDPESKHAYVIPDPESDLAYEVIVDPESQVKNVHVIVDPESLYGKVIKDPEELSGGIIIKDPEGTVTTIVLSETGKEYKVQNSKTILVKTTPTGKEYIKPEEATQQEIKTLPKTTVGELMKDFSKAYTQAEQIIYGKMSKEQLDRFLAGDQFKGMVLEDLLKDIAGLGFYRQLRVEEIEVKDPYLVPRGQLKAYEGACKLDDPTELLFIAAKYKQNEHLKVKTK